MAEAKEQMNVAKMAEEVYGDCYGPESKYVKLISADGHEFILERKYALISPVLENMLNGPGSSSLLSKDEMCDASLNRIERGAVIYEDPAAHITNPDFIKFHKQKTPE